jgi:uncharacterized phage protein gp47/JayE
MEKMTADACQEFGLVNSTIKMICKNRTKITSAFKQQGSRIKRFQKSKRSDVNKALLKLFKQETGDNVLESGSLLMIIFVLPKLQM